jgi:DNA-binding MarR family transcriptional regulator
MSIPSTEIHPMAHELAEIATLLQRRFLIKLTKQVSQTKISIPQFTLLSFLSAHDTLNMGQLAQMMGHTTPATTGLVNRLTETGLVERFTLPSDRRQVMVRITQEGRQIVEDMKVDLASHVSRILDRLPPEDAKAWLRIYRSIHQYCEEVQSAS